MKIDLEINIIMHGLRMNRKLLGNGGNYLPNYEKEYRAIHTGKITHLSPIVKKYFYLY